MSTIKSSDEHLTLNADGSSKDIKFQANGVEKASISSSGAFTSTSINTGTIEADDKVTISYEAGSSDWELESTSGDDFTISRNSQQRLLIDGSTGNVGIGETSPSSILHLKKSSDDIAGATLILENPATGNGDFGSTIEYRGGTGGSGTTDTVLGKITCYKKDNTNGSIIRFQNQQGDFGGLDTPMTINDDGQVLINTTSAHDGNARINVLAESSGECISCKIGNNGSYAINFRATSGDTVGGITVDSSSTAYLTSSDHRLKENVVDMENATDRVKQLKPKRFNFIADDSVTVDGFLAHEVSDIVPEAISGEKDAMKDEEYEVTPAVKDEDGNIVTEAVMGTRSVPDYQGIDQSKLVPLLVKTIQELEARIAALEA